MTNYQHGESATVVAAKLAAPVGVTSVTLAGIHLQDWVLLLTLVYTVLMIGEKLWKWRKAWIAERDAED